MNVLLSSYTCSPYAGSESGVGWSAACRIARKHEVLVLVGERNRTDLERAADEGLVPDAVRFHYLAEPVEYHPNRGLARMQSWLRYRKFNQQALVAAKELHDRERFDLCHQVTIASWRLPSPLWQLPIPFVWGPLGGGGYVPPSFRLVLTPASKCFERARDLSGMLSRRSANFRKCMVGASVVLAANQETMDLLRPFRGGRPLLKLPIASLDSRKINQFKRGASEAGTGPLRCFAGGNMIGTKGLAFALRALRIARDRGVDFHYTVAGRGPETAAMTRLATELGIADRVLFHDGYSGEDYVEALQRSDVYLLPSFREGTPVTMLEACLAGCYPVVADISAQGEIVESCGGHAAPINSVEGLVSGLAEAIVWCSEHRAELPRLTCSIGSRVADQFSSNQYDTILDEAYRVASESV